MPECHNVLLQLTGTAHVHAQEQWLRLDEYIGLQQQAEPFTHRSYTSDLSAHECVCNNVGGSWEDESMQKNNRASFTETQSRTSGSSLRSENNTNIEF